jgi:protein-tyrosine-phosphatase
MTNEIYPLLREADVVVLATPIYFYNVPAQLKAPIDRSQTLWSRKYKLNLTDPARHYRRGFLLAQGATKGKNLFEGVDLTAKYFFDAVGAGFNGSLTYRHIEYTGDMEKHSTVHKDVTASVKELLAPLLGRKKILFACRENACRSQMAAAFAQHLAGDKFEVVSAGSEPAEKINLDMVKAMAEKGIDMGFRKTRFLDKAASELQPDMIITMGCGEACPFIPGMNRLDWDLPDPAGKPMDVMRNVRDEIEKRVKALVNKTLS